MKRSFGWCWTFLMLVICMAAGNAAFAADISGTVTNLSGKPDARVYIKAFPASGPTPHYGGGVSIAAPGTFTIRGLPDGSYILRAFMDVTGSGAGHVSDPLGESPPLQISGGAITSGSADIDLNLLPVENTAPQPPPWLDVYPTDGGAFLEWEAPDAPDSPGLIAADNLLIEWSNDSWATVAGSRPIDKVTRDGFTVVDG
ncbi:carboxypeptidase regulatory-like domain-containing protein, partial [bacterium]|nr:carboxypeptidase regulatory-like domain-containing protein [bacterium]